MATLNRFPLFGMWNRVAAEVLDFETSEAQCIGHAVAVLYAIRAQSGGYRGKKTGGSAAKSVPVAKEDEPLATDEIGFGGDSLPCELDEDGRVVKCLVGCQGPRDAAQTPRSYVSNVETKVPEEFHDRLEEGMRNLLSTYEKMELSGRLIYRLYDEWKKSCKAGRRVDLEKLAEWLEERAASRKAA